MNRLTFRTMFGGPDTPNIYREELRSIKRGLEKVTFVYEIDFSLTFGGQFIKVTKPLGLDSPRIWTNKEKVTGTIFIPKADTTKQSDHAQFLRKIIYESLITVFKKMEKKKIISDAESEIKKVSFLVEN